MLKHAPAHPPVIAATSGRPSDLHPIRLAAVETSSDAADAEAAFKKMVMDTAGPAEKAETGKPNRGSRRAPPAFCGGSRASGSRRQ